MSAQLLTPPQAAERLQVPVRTLDMWRYRGRGPAWLVVGRHIRYDEADLAAWLAAQRHGGPDAAA